jgi:phosphoglycolate phosphatase
VTPFESVFFDVDGTLVDARIDIAGAMNRVSKILERPEKTVEEITSYIGTGVKDLIRKSLDSDDILLIDKATELYESEYLKHPADHAKLYPGVVQTLEALSKKRKFILTNRYAHLASAMLAKLGVMEYFEGVFGGDDESCIKPSACVFERILPGLGLNANGALIVGDMSIDVLAGKNSRVRTCWVTYGLGKKEEVLHLEPDYVIDSITELIDIVK